MRQRIRLKSHRLAAELDKLRGSQNAWAMRLGLSKGYLSLLKSGRRRYPSAEVRRKLLDALGLAFEDLFEVETPGRTRPINVQRQGSRGDGVMELLWQAQGLAQDLRFALRTLFKNRIIAVAAIASLALIVAGNTVVFSVVNTLLIRPLDFDPEARLMLTWRKDRALTFDRRLFSAGDFNEYRRATASSRTWRPIRTAPATSPATACPRRSWRPACRPRSSTSSRCPWSARR